MWLDETTAVGLSGEQTARASTTEEVLGDPDLVTEAVRDQFWTLQKTWNQVSLPSKATMETWGCQSLLN